MNISVDDLVVMYGGDDTRHLNDLGKNISSSTPQHEVAVLTIFILPTRVPFLTI